jgi:hypothetical protein
MALPDRHPEFTARLGEWLQMTDTFDGERAVKSKRLDYLPATEGMVQDGMTTPQSPGWKDYEAYLMRAVYHDVVKDAVKAMVGIMHNKPAEIKLPKKMEPLLDRCTIQGEGLQMLLKRINVAQLKYGRCGLYLDVVPGKPVNEVMPHIAFYDPMRIINWDSGKLNEGDNNLDLVVLDESGERREGFTWKTEKKYRVLLRGGEAALKSGWDGPGEDDDFMFAVKVNDTNMPTIQDFAVPQIGGRTLQEIPFVFIGANDIVPEPDTPPLLGLSNLALAIYRGEADYRQTLYLQGQNTLVVIGGSIDEANPQQLRTGNKGVIDLKIGGDAKYIGVSAAGLGEMRQSLTSDKMAAAQAGIAFLDVGNTAGESGEALRIRVAARTTTISSVSQAAGAGLEKVLKLCAEWMGENPDDVKVTPTTDFADQSVAGAALLAFMQAKQLGLPLSLKSMHRMMKMNDMTEMDFDAENDAIEEEAQSMLGLMVGPQMGGMGGMGDEGFLDGASEPPAPGQPPQGPGSTAPTNQNVPIKPHVRGSPVPLKKKVGKKGASA